jgi:thioredoxin-dependent peroxiredoxin
MNKLRGSLFAVLASALTLAPISYGAGSEPAAPDPLHPGTKAPNFTRVANNGHKISLKDFRGKKAVILYFYPKDETPNCVKEACGFRDFFHGIGHADAEVIGVSGDTEESHHAFAANHLLPFDLISDTDDSLLNLYHVPFYKGSLHKRVTFVIDKKGMINSVIQYTNDGDVHVREALAAVKNINENAGSISMPKQ